MLMILEDNSERIERFAAIIQTIAPTHPFLVWRDAYAMMREAGPLLTFASLISLDHDLEPESNAPDPGDGYMVTKWLVSQSVICPVIIHSSNGERASWMAGEFDLAGWPYWRVPPIGDDWIESDWQQIVHRVLNKPIDDNQCRQPQ